MNPKVQQLANHFGVKLAYRSATGSHVFDGKSIAMSGGSTGTYRRDFSDHDLLHDIAHYAVASPEQRDLPEYGLGIARIAGEIYVPNVVDISGIAEATIQEFMVQLLCVLWGRAYGISPELSATPNDPLLLSWDTYLIVKINDSTHPKCEVYMWQAIIRLRDNGMLDNLPLPTHS
jgi:hypothetical protein